jgi:rhodanese-related sulfurtransferase
MSPEEVNARALAGEPIVYVDSRKPNDWKSSREKIPNALRMPADEVRHRHKELNPDATIITYCT